MTPANQWTLNHYEVEPGSRVGLKLAYTAPQRYDDVLRRAFPSPAAWFGRYGSFDKRFESVMFVQRLPQERLEAFLGFMSETLLVPGPLDEIWALGMHTTEHGFTELRDLVHAAKTYGNKPGDPRKAEKLASLFAERMSKHPAITLSDAIVSVPANPPKEPHNLPEVMARALSQAAGVPFERTAILKTRPTPEIKNLPNEEKLQALQGAYEVAGGLAGKSVVLVDDILYSGTTLGVIGDLLRAASVTQIIGATATKTLRN